MRRFFVLFMLALCGAALWTARGAEAKTDEKDKIRIRGWGREESLTMDKIGDIVLWTTGGHDWPRQSLLACVRGVDYPAHGPLRIKPFRRDDGKGTWGAGGIGKDDVGTAAAYHTAYGIQTAVGEQRRRDAGGKDQGLTMMWPVWGTGDVKLQFARAKMGDQFELVATPHGEAVQIGGGDSVVFITDATGGLFPQGEHDGEQWFTDLFLVAYKDQNDNASVAIVDPETGKSRTVFLLPSLRGDHPVVRVAAGDLDGDGKANEFAVIFGYVNEQYCIQVYQVGADWSGSVPRLLYSGQHGKRDSKAEEFDGCDIMVGDFDGDGRQELAAVYAHTKDGNHGYPAVLTLRYDKEKGAWSSRETLKEDDLLDEDQIPSELKRGSNTLKDWQKAELAQWQLGHHWDQKTDKHPRFFGLIADAGDLDGDGKDEIVFLCRRYVDHSENNEAKRRHGDLMLAVWGTDKDLKPRQRGGRCVFARDGEPNVRLGYLTWHLLMGASLALPITGEASDVGGRPKRDILVSTSTNELGKHKLLRLGYGALSGLSDPVELDAPADADCLKLLAGDFYYEKLELDTPTHAIFEDELYPIVALQAMPYHVDYVQATDEVLGNGRPSMDRKAVLNMTHKDDARVSYTRSSTESTTKDVSFTNSTSGEFGVNGHIGLMAGDVLGAQLTGHAGILGSAIDETISTSVSRVTFAMTDTAQVGDARASYKADRHVWRYPILTPVQPYDEIPPGDLSGERFLTFSLCDTPAWDSISGSGASCWDETYGPEHEEGNLFSYPSHVEDTPGYEERQEGPVVTRPDSFNVSGGEKKYLKVESASEDVAAQTSQTNVNAGFGVVGNIGVPDVGFGLEILAEGVDIKLPKIDIFGFEVAPNFIWNKTQMDVSTKTYETSESFEVDPGGQGLPCTGTDHKVSAAFFVDPAGAMNVAFGVDLLTDTAEPRAAWRRDGMYGDRPDPALVLPERFTYDRKAGLWSSEPDKWSATQLRGIRFWDELAKTWTTSCLAQDGQYRIQVPLYNASFKDAGDVTVEMSIRRHHSEDVVKVLGRKTAHLGGWPNNKAKVSFDLSGADLLGLDPHDPYHDLCFVLDPDGEIEELHEEWGKEADGGDPGGNNVGRYPIGVIHSRPMYTSGDVTCYADGSETPVRTKATAAAAAAAGEEGFTVWFEPVREDDARTRLSVAEFRQELAEQTESFRAHGWVRYNGPGPLTGLHVTVAHLESDGSRQIIARKIVPALYPDREYPFSFIVSPGTVEKEKFIIDVAGHGVSLRWPHEDERPTPDDQPDDEGSSSGGGCSTHAGTSAGLGGLALLALGALLLRGRDRK